MEVGIVDDKKTGLIKYMNDFVLGIILAAAGIWLLFGKITDHEVSTGQGGFIARPDVWVRFMAIILIVDAAVLIVRSIVKKNDDPAGGRFQFYLDSTQVGTIISLVIYTLLLPVFGFFIMTFVVTFYLVLLYSIKEKAWTFRTAPKDQWPKLLLKTLIISTISLLVYWLVFGVALSLQLPGFELFYLLGQH